MYSVDVYLRVRRAVMVEGKSIGEVSREFGLHRDTVGKMLAYSVPPGYRRQTPPRRPKLEPFTGVIDRILEDDLGRPGKQRHTAKRIFERLRDEYGFDGGYTTVKDYVRENAVRSGRCSCRCPMRRDTPSATSARPWWSLAAWSARPLLRTGPAPQRRLLREGLPGGVHRGLPGRARISALVPGRSAPEHPLRQYQAGRGEDTGGRPSPAHPVLHRVAVPLPVRGPVRAPRQG